MGHRSAWSSCPCRSGSPPEKYSWFLVPITSCRCLSQLWCPFAGDALRVRSRRGTSRPRAGPATTCRTVRTTRGPEYPGPSGRRPRAGRVAGSRPPPFGLGPIWSQRPRTLQATLARRRAGGLPTWCPRPQAVVAKVARRPVRWQHGSSEPPLSSARNDICMGWTRLSRPRRMNGGGEGIACIAAQATPCPFPTTRGPGRPFHGSPRPADPGEPWPAHGCSDGGGDHAARSGSILAGAEVVPDWAPRLRSAARRGATT